MTIGGCFERYTYDRVTALGSGKKVNYDDNSDFRPFQVCRFKTVITHCYYYCRLGQAHFYTQLAFVPPPPRENANTLIGAAILLKSGHPYMWATLPRTHNTWILKETEPMDACN